MPVAQRWQPKGSGSVARFLPGPGDQGGFAFGAQLILGPNSIAVSASVGRENRTELSRSTRRLERQTPCANTRAFRAPQTIPKIYWRIRSDGCCCLELSRHNSSADEARSSTSVWMTFRLRCIGSEARPRGSDQIRRSPSPLRRIKSRCGGLDLGVATSRCHLAPQRRTVQALRPIFQQNRAKPSYE
jgi:hypothetical protein